MVPGVWYSPGVFCLQTTNVFLLDNRLSVLTDSYICIRLTVGMIHYAVNDKEQTRIEPLLRLCPQL